jgi:3-hydroxybutyryl-CoA dehydrogenase
VDLKPPTVGVVGTGTMGTGIAQVAALAGHRVLLFDAELSQSEKAASQARESVRTLVQNGKLQTEADRVLLDPVGSLESLRDCGLVIEAIVEDLETKRSLFRALEDVVQPGCVLASNSSSLSPTAISAGLSVPGRFVGLHFFNPVPVMQLVEVIPGHSTRSDVIEFVADLVRSWGKTVVRSTPTPGFIVNRVARPFYSEAWRLFEEQAADPATIDAILTGGGGFRLGPFALMDLIGHDVNEAVTKTVWQQMGHDPWFSPSVTQRGLVEAGWLGRKTQRGIYRYDEGGRDLPDRPPVASSPHEVFESGDSGLGTILKRAGVRVRRDPSEHARLILPSGLMVRRCDGTTANELSVEFRQPVVLVDHTVDDGTATAMALASSAGCPPEGLSEAVGLLQRAGLDVYLVDDIPGMVVTRVVSMLVNLAADAAQKGVASAGEIDTAMRLGTGYPLGPFEWGNRWGLNTIIRILDALESCYRDGHYRPSPGLRRMATARTPSA